MDLQPVSARAAWLAVGLALLAQVAACQAQPPSPGTAADPGLKAEASLMERIRGEIGEARCDRDEQCHTLAVGEKACGGPVSYLAWSGSPARAQQLQAWAAELATLQRRRAAASGMMSNCQFLPDPGAVCVQQRCVLRASASGAGAR